MPDQCHYCDLPLIPQGFLENQDALGTYTAQTFQCPQCGYRLEKNPVYIDNLEDDEARPTYTVGE